MMLTHNVLDTLRWPGDSYLGGWLDVFSDVRSLGMDETVIQFSGYRDATNDVVWSDVPGLYQDMLTAAEEFQVSVRLGLQYQDDWFQTDPVDFRVSVQEQVELMQDIWDSYLQPFSYFEGWYVPQEVDNSPRFAKPDAYIAYLQGIADGQPGSHDLLVAPFVGHYSNPFYSTPAEFTEFWDEVISALDLDLHIALQDGMGTSRIQYLDQVLPYYQSLHPVTYEGDLLYGTLELFDLADDPGAVAVPADFGRVRCQFQALFGATSKILVYEYFSHFYRPTGMAGAAELRTAYEDYLGGPRTSVDCSEYIDAPPTPEPVLRRGVSMAGADFGALASSPWPGEHGSEYVYPHLVPEYLDAFDYYRGLGFNVLRLPFRWERLQPALGGDLDPVELARIRGFLDVAQQHGFGVILDVHNYARYCLEIARNSPYCSDDRLIGVGDVTVEHFADFWARVAASLHDHPGLWAYGLMNEPTYPEAQYGLWQPAAQAAIDAIRFHDLNNVILVPGNHWSGAYTWPATNPSLERLADPANNLVFEAHLYFDDDRAGEYDGAAPPADPKDVVALAEPFLRWLEQHDLRGFIGEFGVPVAEPGWGPALDAFLTALDERCIGATWWAAGPWWTDYPLGLDPADDGTEQWPAQVLKAHSDVPGCSTP